MAEFTSEVKTILYDDDKIFNLLSDLNNLEKLKHRIPEDKVKDFSYDEDSCSFSVNPVGNIKFRIIDREPNKTIKFETTESPVPINLWIQLKHISEKNTKMKMTLRAELNPFLKPMVSKPLQEALDKISDIIAQLPYEQE
jgi:hypothetical protein